MDDPTPLLQCPRDGAPLASKPGAGALECAGSAHTVRVIDGILDFTPERSLYDFPFWYAAIYDLVLPTVGLPRFFGARTRALQELHAQASAAARGGTLVDVPCGTGVFSIPAAASGGVARFLGVDLSLPMLRIASRRARRHGVGATLLRADACALPIADGAADVVVCCLGLQFIEDRARCLRAVRRALRPSGVFFGAAPATGLDARYDRRHASRKRKDFPLNKDTFPEELAESGFGDIHLSMSGALVLWDAKAATEPLNAPVRRA